MTETDQNGSKPGFAEFVILMALITSLAALSIDAILPALPDIGRDLDVQRANDNQLVVSLLILGMAVGQMVYGPMSDSIGRKPTIYAGISLFIIGCLLSIFAVNFKVLLAGRLLQGLGVAGPRVATVALVRDQYAGRAMARVMSFIMTVFIIVPAIAPTLGQIILLFAHWRAIFVLFLVLALTGLIWFAIRQPETLAVDKRIPFSLKRVLKAIREVFTHPVSFGYMVSAGLVFGAFVGYLNSAQQIFQIQYELGTQFPLYFAAVALAIGSASVVNARLVMRYGMRVLTSRSSLILGLLSTIFYIVAYTLGGHPPLWALMTYFMFSFFFMGILFGNLNASAMEPLGHIAGIGAAVVGFLSTLISVILGTIIGQSYNDTILPLVGGYAILSTITMLLMKWTEARRPVAESE